MTAAVITDNYLTTTPWDRKTDFYNAFKVALTNAGFTTTLDEYDRTDKICTDWLRGNYTQYQAGGSNSIKGIIKQIVFDNTKAKGTVQFDFFSVKNNTNDTANHDGIGRGNTDFDNQSTCPGVACYWGGWDSSNARRNLYTTTDTAIGSWYGVKPTYTADMHNYDNSLRNGQLDGNYDGSYDGTWNSTTGYQRNFYPNGYTHTPGYASQSWYGSNWTSFGYTNTANPMCRLPHPNFPIQFKAINHPEIRGVFMLQQGRAPSFFGYVRPATKPTWWNEDNYPYVFIPMTPMFQHFQSFSSTYFPIPSTPYYAYHELLVNEIFYKNPFTSKFDAMSSPMIRYATNNSILGKFSSDIIMIPSDGISIFDKIVVTAGVQEYLVISGTRPTGAEPGLAIRIV